MLRALGEALCDDLRVEWVGKDLRPILERPRATQTSLERLTPNSSVEWQTQGTIVGGTQITGRAGQGGNGIRHEQVDVCRDSALEGLRGDGEARPRETQALSLDWLVLEEFCRQWTRRSTCRRACSARRSRAGRSGSGDDGVVVWTGNGLVDSALDEEARGTISIVSHTKCATVPGADLSCPGSA